MSYSKERCGVPRTRNLYPAEFRKRIVALARAHRFYATDVRCIKFDRFGQPISAAFPLLFRD